MIEETISRIEERLRAAENLAPGQRLELQGLLAQLRREARNLPPEALTAQLPPDAETAETAETAMGRLEESLAAFETSHPQLTGVVNRISAILSNMGI